ncbi:phosphotransferase [Candidatus Woesearchaeota archaeon]|nr:phosphotransferase [Candidatus Woesearchaeota archaeon]
MKKTLDSIVETTMATGTVIVRGLRNTARSIKNNTPLNVPTIAGLSAGIGTYAWLDLYHDLSDQVASLLQTIDPSQAREGLDLPLLVNLSYAAGMAVLSRAAVIQGSISSRERKRRRRIEAEERETVEGNEEIKRMPWRTTLASVVSAGQKTLGDMVWNWPAVAAAGTMMVAGLWGIRSDSIRATLDYLLLEYFQQSQLALSIASEQAPAIHQEMNEQYLGGVFAATAVGASVMGYAILKTFYSMVFSAVRTELQKTRRYRLNVPDFPRTLRQIRRAVRKEEALTHTEHTYTEQPQEAEHPYEPDQTSLTMAKLYVTMGRFDDALRIIRVEMARRKGKKLNEANPLYFDYHLVGENRKTRRENPQQWFERIIAIAERPEYATVIEDEFERRIRTRPNDPLPLFLQYYFSRGEGRKKSARHTLERIIAHLQHTHGLDLSGRIGVYKTDYLSRQLAIRYGNTSSLEREMRVTGTLRDRYAEVIGIGRKLTPALRGEGISFLTEPPGIYFELADPLDVLVWNGLGVYVMELAQGTSLALLDAPKQRYLEEAARFNGWVHTMTGSSVTRDGPREVIDYRRRVLQRVRESNLPIDKEKVAAALGKILDAYPAHGMVLLRDGHQENYLVNARSNNTPGSLAEMTAIDFELQGLGDPAIDLTKLMNHGLPESGTDEQGSTGQGSMGARIDRMKVIEAYKEGRVLGGDIQGSLAIPDDQLLLHVLAKSPAVLFSYLCWSEQRVGKWPIQAGFMGNTVQCLAELRERFPEECRRHEKQYLLLGKAIQSIAMAYSAASGNRGLLSQTPVKQ